MEAASSTRPDGVLDPAWRSRADFRAKCRQSLYYHTKTVTCSTEPRNLMTSRTFLESCDWLQNVICNERRGLFEDSRNHIKSYRTTVAIPQWIAVQRPHPDYDHPDEINRAERFLSTHLHIKGPDTRIIIASEADKAAMAWVRLSKAQWESNQLLRWAFPELIWDNPDSDPDCRRWSDEEYYLPGRKVIYRDGFLRAMGIKSKSSGGRGDIILVDDLVSEPSAESPTELAYRCNWLRSITQQMENRDRTKPDGSAVLYINNRWNFDDPNSMVHDELDWPVWHRAAWICGTHGFGNCGRQPSDEPSDCTPTADPIWPERHSDLDAIRVELGDFIFYTQWGNKPEAKAELDASKLMPFRLEVIAVDGVRTWHVVIDEQRDRESNTLVCPAETIPINQLRSHLISIDPAAADEASEARKRGKTARWGLTWQAFDPPTGRDFVLAAPSAHYAPDKAIEAIYELWLDAARKLGTKPRILCERVAAQTMVGSALRFKAQAAKHKIPEVEMIPPARGPQKWGRVHSRIGNRLGNRCLYVRQGLLIVHTETRHAPHGTYDTLDAIAQAEGEFQKLQNTDREGSARRARRKFNRRVMLSRAGRAGM